MSDRNALARAILPAPSQASFEVPRERLKTVPFTEEELSGMRGGLSRGISVKAN
jgi:hypothetical protein